MTNGHRFGRPSLAQAAIVLSVVALVAALAGQGIALPGRNRVTSDDIKKNAVRT